MNNNTQNTQALTTISTRTHGEDAIPLATIGTLDGVTAHGEPITLQPRGGRADVIVTGKAGQLYVENKPRATVVAAPRLTVNGKVRKNTSYERGVFQPHGAAKNTAARKIAKAVLTDPTVTLTTGETVTLEGTWTVWACVKTLKTGKLLRSTHVLKGEGHVINCINN